MSRKVLMKGHNGARRFYCWGHDCWYPVGKLSYCFAKPEFCRFICVPPGAHHRKAAVLAAGQLIRAEC